MTDLRPLPVRQPALVVLDLTLEDGNGLVLLDRLRSADGLAMTGSASQRASRRFDPFPAHLPKRIPKR